MSDERFQKIQIEYIKSIGQMSDESAAFQC